MSLLPIVGHMAETLPIDHEPDYLYGVVYRLQRPPEGNPDGS